MTLLTEETAVFSAAAEGKGRCAVAFLLRRKPAVIADERRAIADAVDCVLQGFGRTGWRLSVRSMMDLGARDEPSVYASGFAHDVDYVGLFEAPSIDSAMQGTLDLERGGWIRLFSTEWLIGPREFAAIHGAGVEGRRDWGFIALWEWNDAWCAASSAERKDYDAECDVAFNFDLQSGIDIAGRHRPDWASRWHHLGAWEAASLEKIDRAMQAHERASDFKFTTSRHFVGLRRRLSEVLRSTND
jgi:hypothetical protein